MHSPNNVDPTPFFQKMVSLRDSIDQSLKLSMGMSNDYKIALDNGSNLIRVGSTFSNNENNIFYIYTNICIKSVLFKHKM